MLTTGATDVEKRLCNFWFYKLLDVRNYTSHTRATQTNLAVFTTITHLPVFRVKSHQPHRLSHSLSQMHHPALHVDFLTLGRGPQIRAIDFSVQAVSRVWAHPFHHVHPPYGELIESRMAVDQMHLLQEC
jgi:hypothetical protein